MIGTIEITSENFNPAKAWRPHYPMTEMGKLDRIAAQLDVDLICVAGTYQVMLTTTWRELCTLVGSPYYIAKKINGDMRIVEALLKEFWRVSKPNEWVHVELANAAKKAIERGYYNRQMRETKKTKKVNEINDTRLEQRTKNQEPTSMHETSSPNPETVEVTRALRRATPRPLSFDWQPAERERAIAMKAGLKPHEIETVTKKFKAYWLARKNKKKADWGRAFIDWVCGDIERWAANPRSRPKRESDGTTVI